VPKEIWLKFVEHTVENDGEMTYCGGSVAFSMMQTRDRLDPLSMWYSSSANIKASGVSTFSSTLWDWMPVSDVTWNQHMVII